MRWYRYDNLQKNDTTSLKASMGRKADKALTAGQKREENNEMKEWKTIGC